MKLRLVILAAETRKRPGLTLGRVLLARVLGFDRGRPGERAARLGEVGATFSDEPPKGKQPQVDGCADSPPMSDFRIVAASGRVIRAKAVLSNANIKNTIFRLAGEGSFPADYLDYVALQLNRRPRKTLHWKTPAEALDELLSDPSKPPAVASTA